MKQIISALRRTSTGGVAALFLLTAVFVALPEQKASAGGLLYRSLELTSSQPSGLTGTDLEGAGGEAADPGEAANGDEVGHKYVFQVRTAASVAAFKIQYCTTAFGYLAFNTASTCTKPTDFDATNATTATVEVFETLADYQAGTPVKATQTYTQDAASTDQELILTGTALATLDANDFVRITVAPTASVHFKNPSTTGTFFAHVETYATQTTATTSETHIDEGTVTSSTANTIAINSRVQEALNFSVEGEDNAAAGPSVAEGSSCAALGVNGDINIGDPNNEIALASDRTYDGLSYFRLATNSANGAKVLYAGETLRSTAGDEIDSIGTTKETATRGEEEFGLAFAADYTNANGDNDVQAAANTLNANDLYADAAYSTGDKDFDVNNVAEGDYAFDTTSNGAPKLIAQSDDVVKCDTGVVRYIANISTDTPAGIYTTKVSYIAVPSY